MIRFKSWLVVGALAAVAGGCADDYAGLLILHNQAPNENCQTMPNTSDPYIPHGTASIGVNGGGYELTPLIQSTLINREATTNGDIVQLHTAVVEIGPVDSADSRAVIDALKELRGRTRYLSGSVSPKGLTSTAFTAIDSDQAKAMASVMQPGQRVEVLVHSVVHGDTQGTDVSSNDFVYPITLINSGGGGFIDLGPCSGLPTGTAGSVTDCFGTGQDGGFVECCTDPGGRAVCPAVGTGG